MKKILFFAIAIMAFIGCDNAETVYYGVEVYTPRGKTNSSTIEYKFERLYDYDSDTAAVQDVNEIIGKRLEAAYNDMEEATSESSDKLSDVERFDVERFEKLNAWMHMVDMKYYLLSIKCSPSFSADDYFEVVRKSGFNSPEHDNYVKENNLIIKKYDIYVYDLEFLRVFLWHHLGESY